MNNLMAVQGGKWSLLSVQSRIICFPSHSIWDGTSPVRCQRVSLTNFDMKFIAFS